MFSLSTSGGGPRALGAGKYCSFLILNEHRMKQRTLFSVLALGLVVGVSSAIALTGVRAATTDSSSVTTAVDTPVTITAAATSDPAPPVLRRGKHLNEMAKQLGMTTADLQAALQSGKEFYQIAAEHGLTYSKLMATREAEMKTRFQDMVKVGFMTQAEADAALKNWQEKSAEMPMMGLGGGHRGRF